jgi:tetratricopeptide (TPR) repeat protein
MELVRGAPLTEHVRAPGGSHGDGPLDMEQRLRLFCRVCDAIHHAHQRGVIHRDLKPSNILVSQPESTSRAVAAGSTSRGSSDLPADVKVLDFGLARITDADIEVSTLVTEAGRVVGTLRYMSPEQARGDADRIDTRTDIYSLGVILYELITDRSPYRLDDAPPHQALRAIIEYDPVRPSTLRKSARGDLETITLKALDKDPARRYESAAALADDVQRYLDGYPILARPASMAYQLRKFARRNRAIVVAACLAAIALLGGSIGTGLGWVRAARAEQGALNEASRAEAVSTLLTSAMASIRPEVALGQDTALLEQVLKDAERRIESDLADQPDVEATLRDTIGQTYLSLSRYEPAARHLQRAAELRRVAGGDPAKLAETLARLANTRQYQGDYASSERLFLDALALARVAEGASGGQIGRVMTDYALALKSDGRLDEALARASEAYELLSAEYDGDHPDVAAALANLGVVYSVRKEPHESIKWYQRALEMNQRMLPDMHPEIGKSLQNMAAAYFYLDDFEKAERHLREALDVWTRTLGPDHAETARCMRNLGDVLSAAGRQDEAEPLLREALRVYRLRFGETHPQTAKAIKTLGVMLYEKGDPATAEPMLREALTLQKARLGPDHLDLGYTWHDLASCYTAMDRPGEAEPCEREAIRIFALALGDDHPVMTRLRQRLASQIQAQGRLDEAAALYDVILARQREQLGPQHTETGKTLHSVALLHLKQDEPGRAEPLLREAAAIFTEALGEGHYRTATTRHYLGHCLARLQRFEESEPWLVESFPGIEAYYAPRAPRRVTGAIERIVSMYRAWGKLDRAAAWQARLTDSRPSGE